MRALLDTNIVIHREAPSGINPSIGTLFKWLDKSGYEKCIHPITIAELQKHHNDAIKRNLNIKLQSYTTLMTVAPMAALVQAVSEQLDTSANDVNDSRLLNEVFQGRVDILVSEDRKIHLKAQRLGIQHQVFRIDAFLEKVVSENPNLVDYSVLSVKKLHFGNIDLSDSFFDSFRTDYADFDRWFNRKADEVAYVTHKNGAILSFLFLKLEDESENYANISPMFKQKRRLKVGTFKVVSNGLKLGERFLKIIFDNAISNKAEEIYVTIFERTDDQKRLIRLLQDWGFEHHGMKTTTDGNELVYVRDLAPRFDVNAPRLTYPYVSANRPVFLCPIYPKYHTELFPDSILTTESRIDFEESHPHRNALRKIFISRSINRDLASGDVIVFYRTGGYHRGVVTTIGLVESVIDGIVSETEFLQKCRKRSVFTDDDLSQFWNHKPQSRPFIVNFLYVYSFPKRPNMAKLIELGVIADSGSAPRGFERITKDQFISLIKASDSNESIIVY